MAKKMGNSNKSASQSRSAPTLDLHGKRVEEVFDLIEGFLQRYGDQPKLRIMPGKGTGKIREEVIRYLKLGNYPWSYERLSNGDQNQGVLLVHND